MNDRLLALLTTESEDIAQCDNLIVEGTTKTTRGSDCHTSTWIQQVLSANPDDRMRAANTASTIPTNQHWWGLITLLRDNEPAVYQSALRAIGYPDHNELWHDLIQGLGDIETRPRAVALLSAYGPAILPVLVEALNCSNTPIRLRLIQVMGRIAGKDALDLLSTMTDETDEEARTAVLNALRTRRHRIAQHQVRPLELQCCIEANYNDFLSATRNDLSMAPLSVRPTLSFLVKILTSQINRSQQRLSDYRALLQNNLGSMKAYETEPAAPESLVERSEKHKNNRTEWQQCLIQLLESPHNIIDTKLWACTANTAIRLNIDPSCVRRLIASACCDAPNNRLLQETRFFSSRTYGSSLTSTQECAAVTEHNPNAPTLSTIERAAYLKAIDLFCNLPVAPLIELASMLEEVELRKDHVLFHKNDSADGLYIITSGKLVAVDSKNRIHQHVRGCVLGELGLLDARPRMMSVRAVEDSRLLKLDHEGFYLSLGDHIELAQGVIQKLSGYLRGHQCGLTDLELSFPNDD